MVRFICVFTICILILFTLSSCSTLRANILLIEQTSKEEKAELVFRQGVYLYNTNILKNMYLAEIPGVEQHFNDALKLDPSHKEAKVYKKKVDEYKDELFISNIVVANELFNKESRNKEEDFRLVLAVKQATDLKLKHESLKELKKGTKELRSTIIKNHVIRIKILEEMILEETRYQVLVNLLRKAKKQIKELDTLDSRNKIALKSRDRIQNYIDSLTIKDILSARECIHNKDFIKAELIVRQLEIRHKTFSFNKIDKLDRLKYDLFYLWGNELLIQHKYTLAKNITNLAYDIYSTDDVKKMLKKIDKMISSRDYEASINDILASVDYYISIEKPSKAKNIIDLNYNKMKLKRNKNALLNKINLIDEYIAQSYNSGVLLYNEEDYEGAMEKFSIIVSYDKKYNQVEAYYNKTSNKIKALSGSF